MALSTHLPAPNPIEAAPEKTKRIQLVAGGSPPGGALRHR